MQAEIVISAALVVLAIAFSAALVAVCIVVGSSFISITFALTDHRPQFPQMRRRKPTPSPEPREVPERSEPQRERERRDSELATDIMSNAGEGIIVYDRDLRCLVWNKFMEDLTGLPADEILGRVLKGETVSLAETTYLVPGTERQGWISAAYRPQHDSTGAVSGVIGRMLDLTERKRA